MIGLRTDSVYVIGVRKIVIKHGMNRELSEGQFYHLLLTMWCGVKQGEDLSALYDALHQTAAFCNIVIPCKYQTILDAHPIASEFPEFAEKVINDRFGGFDITKYSKKRQRDDLEDDLSVRMS